MSTNYHPLTKKLVDLISKRGFWFETFEHEPVKTSEEASKVRSGYSISEGAKALIMRIKTAQKRDFVMLVVPGDARFDSEKLKAVLTTKDIRFATSDEIDKITSGVKIGGIPPFGNLFGLVVYADENIFAREKIIFNAGDRRFSIAMRSSDYKTIVEPKVVSVVNPHS